jgi:hypothetical protein
MGKWAARGRLGRIFAALPVDVKQSLGFRIILFKIGIF